MCKQNPEGYDLDDSRLTESDSDGGAAPRVVKKKSSTSRTNQKRWLPVRSYDTDDIDWRRHTEMTSSSRISYGMADVIDDDGFAETTRLSMTSAVSDDAIARNGVLELMEDDDDDENETWRMSENSIAVAETRFSHDV